MLSLYYSPGTASMVIHLALLECGAEFELRLVDFETQQQHDAAYLKLNPNGQVPTLVVDGHPYYESAALLMLLSERFPQSGLLPATEHDRNRWRQLIVQLANGLLPTFRLWFYPPDLGVEEHSPEVKRALQLRIEGMFDKFDHHLSQNGPYLLGEHFSSADLMLVMLSRWSRNMPKPATQWPALQRLIERVVARPSWKKMMEVEKLSAWPN